MKNYLFAALFASFLACSNTSEKQYVVKDSTHLDKYYDPNSDNPVQHKEVLMNVTESGDTSFVVKAIKFNQQQVRMADLAEKVSSDTAIKRIASNLRTDHQVLLRDLYKVYHSKDSSKGSVPETEKAASDSILSDRTGELSEEMKELEKLEGKKFDREWVNIMIAKHEKSIADYEKELKGNEDTQLVELLHAAISKLREHRVQLEAWNGKS